MHTVFGLESLTPNWSESTVCIGVFDGVHRGHQALIGAAVGDAQEHSRPCIALTFDRHPMAVLRPRECPKAILALDEKIAKIANCNVDILVVARFDKEFASLYAEQFVQHVLREKLKAVSVVVGHDFAFGKDRGGDVEFLRARMPTQVMPPFEHHGQRVGSTGIRDAIEKGDIALANELLDSAFALAAIVVPGNRLARELGMPTINLALTTEQVLPANGIYAGWADTPLDRFEAAISIGDRPTFEGAGFAIEAHLLDFPDVEMYGRDVTLWFSQRVRDERRFGTQEDLVEQMQLDVKKIRVILGAHR